jgi:protein-S-isoprenylcysteine O-methyltransferase Ste14
MSSSNDIFRLILFVGISILLPIGIYHRLKAHVKGEKLDRRREGLLILITLRPLGLLAWGGLVAFVITPESMAWASVPLSDWVRWLGVGIAVMGAALLIWTFRTLGGNLTDTVVTRANHTLVTNGPYVWVRHPFYCAAALTILGGSLITANWFLFAIGLIVLRLIVMRTRTEEEHLLARFGEKYREYKKRTGRFLPRIN